MNVCVSFFIIFCVPLLPRPNRGWSRLCCLHSWDILTWTTSHRSGREVNPQTRGKHQDRHRCRSSHSMRICYPHRRCAWQTRIERDGRQRCRSWRGGGGGTQVDGFTPPPLSHDVLYVRIFQLWRRGTSDPNPGRFDAMSEISTTVLNCRYHRDSNRRFCEAKSPTEKANTRLLESVSSTAFRFSILLWILGLHFRINECGVVILAIPPHPRCSKTPSTPSRRVAVEQPHDAQTDLVSHFCCMY